MVLGFYFDIFLLSLIVLVLVSVSVSYFLGFGKCFKNLFILLLLMVIFNFLCLFSDNLVFCLVLLVFLSFYSMFLILYGYGLGFKVLVVLFFKGLADVLVIVLASNVFFLQLDFSLHSFSFLGFDLTFVLVLVFLVYSLFGVFGLWLFWAMEASYFISCFMHSCGFISVGLIFFVKLSLLGVLVDLNEFLFLVNVISLLSYIFFMVLFFTIKDGKSSFGFYSASSICFLLFTSVNFPVISISYFFLSSIIKILIFEMLSYLNKVSSLNWFVFTLVVFNVFLFSLFFLVKPYCCFCLELVYFIFLFKSFSLLLFLFKVFSILELSVMGTGLGFFVFSLLVLLLNKLFFFVSSLSCLSVIFSYFVLLSVFFSFNFYSFSGFSVIFLFISSSFNFICSGLDYLLFYFKVVSFSHILSLNLFKSPSLFLSKEQIIFYCLVLPVFLVLFF